MKIQTIVKNLKNGNITYRSLTFKTLYEIIKEYSRSDSEYKNPPLKWQKEVVVNLIIKNIKELKVIAKQYNLKVTHYPRKYQLVNAIYKKYIEKDIERRKKQRIIDDMLKKIKEAENMLMENKTSELLRLNRVIKNNIIKQNSVVPITINTTLTDIFEDKYAVYFYEHINQFIQKAKDALYKIPKIITANIQAEYAYADSYDKPVTVRHTVMHDFGINKDVNTLGFSNYNGGHDTKGIFIIIGYRIIYTTSSHLTQENIRSLKAYNPSSNRKYHELTTASTSNNKLCIYETFLDIIGKRDLKYARNKDNRDDIKKLLKDEGDDIIKSVKNGELINSVELLTKKYDTEILIIFYGSLVNKTDKPLIISKGITRCITKSSELNNWIGKKYMLYEKNIHVAPAILKKDINMDKIEELREKINKKFSLRPQYIKSSKNKQNNILGFDTETYCDEQNNAIVYCICLYGYLNGLEVKESFYGIDAINNFMKYIESITIKINNKKSRPKGKSPYINIYGFNNSRFDNIFIYQYFYNLDPNTKYVFAGNSVKYIKYNNIKIFDISLQYKIGDLRSTAKAFKLEKEKGVFPYRFPNKFNLDYIGEVPRLSYWNSKEDYDEYINNNGNIFNMKEYTIKYCMLDSLLVYELAKIHINMCHGNINNRNYNVSEAPTSAKLAIKMFTQCFLEESLQQSPDNIIEKERFAYKGGRTEVFKKRFISNNKDHKLYYFDINSAYPAGMTKQMPYKYTHTLIWNENQEINENMLIDTDLYLAKIQYIGKNDNFIPNILLRDQKTNSICAFKNIDFSYHWGIELKEALRNECKVNLKEQNTYETKEVFKSFSEFFYNERLKVKKTNEVLSLFYKNVLNSLYGKFGQKPFNKSALCTSVDDIYNKINNDSSLLLDLQIINDNLFMIEYKNVGDEYESIGKLVRFASYITSTARCKLSAFMRDVGHENVYYCDTDSVFTTKIPSKDFIDQNVLGKWKQECAPITNAIFLAPKTYYYQTEDDKVTTKSKGISNKDLNSKEYEDLLDGNISSISRSAPMFFRSLNGVKIKDQIRNIVVVDNKRKWVDNHSIAYENINEWKCQ